MNAPNLWQSFLIIVLGFAALPYFIALLGKLRLLPLGIFYLAVNLFPSWANENRFLSIGLFTLFALYPVLSLVLKIVRWYQEEIWARNYLLATAHHWNDPDNLIER